MSKTFSSPAEILTDKSLRREVDFLVRKHLAGRDTTEDRVVLAEFGFVWECREAVRRKARVKP
jgi:hypothetical protein